MSLLGEQESNYMSTNVVNLDALIPREDFAVTDARPLTKTLDQVTVLHLEGPFFGPDLRKPDFQRATQHWTPTKVVELIRAFVDKDLIPAVILWRSGSYVFVVDGAHRLSALLAWIFDDYGDRQKSLEYFGGHISEEQRKIAQRTRDLVNKTVGSYAQYRAARNSPGGVPEEMRTRLSNLGDANLVAQWVPTNDAAIAEDSFFKINQAATALDSTEARILKARRSATAIASRAVMHAGTGHKYWSSFSPELVRDIESFGDRIYRAIYEPPITGTPLNTLDVPLAGKGYNALPFVFELVNQINKVEVPDPTAKRKKVPMPPPDKDGETTLAYLKAVFAAVEGITTDHPGSLGLHPVVYFYSRTGAFQPVSFFGALIFVEWLRTTNSIKNFMKVRAAFEEYLLAHREAASLMAHTFGAGARSYPWMGDYYKRVFEAFAEGLDQPAVEQRIAADKDFGFTTIPRPSARRRSSSVSKGDFSTTTKTMAYFDQALPTAIRCGICGARVHKNSMHIDHKIRVQDGGHHGPGNAQVTHPYCDSAVKN